MRDCFSGASGAKCANCIRGKCDVALFERLHELRKPNPR